MSQHIEFIPTPEQIAAACREIQATWSDAERQRRINMKIPTIGDGKLVEALARGAIDEKLRRQRAG